ncbi:MAG: hypothetical protein HYY40_09090 [Bacteroidetes bacterium]|nr:hypothetical protein [Bacteroidota bacterium]
MKEKDKVHKLIRSLSGAEKRYFKIFTEQFTVGENNQFIRLFNAIGSLEKYDDKEITHHFEGEKFVRYLSSKKVHLYNHMIRSLQLFHSGKTADVRVVDLLKSVRLLYDKGLDSHCESLLQKAKRISYRYEKFALLLEILEWERIIIYSNPTNVKKQLRHINKEKLLALEKLNTIEKYQSLLDVPLRFIYGMGFIRRRSDLKTVDSIMRHPFLMNKKYCNSFSSLLDYYRTLAGCLVLKRDLKRCLKFRKAAAHLFDSFPYMIGEYLETWLNVHYGLLIIGNEIRKTEIMEETIQKLKNLHRHIKYPVPPVTEGKIFFLEKFYTLKILIHKKDFRQAEVMGNAILPGIEQRPVSLMPQLRNYLLIELAAYLIFSGNMHLSLRLMNSVMHDTSCEKPHHFMVLLRMLYMIVHFELGHKQLLEYLSKSDERYFIKHKILYKFEMVMLRTFKKLSVTGEPDRQIELLTKLKQQLLLLKDDRFEGMPFQDFDYLLWIDKITGRLG